MAWVLGLKFQAVQRTLFQNHPQQQEKKWNIDL